MNRKILTLVSLVVFVFFLGVQAATAGWVSVPLDGEALQSFLPFVVNNLTTQSASPSGVLYVFATDAYTDGKPGGRPGMNAICTAEDPESFFCTIQEIETAFQTTGVYFPEDDRIRNPSWIDNVDLSEEHWAVNSCGGWNTDFGIEQGTTLQRTAARIRMQSCNVENPVTCCKWIP